MRNLDDIQALAAPFGNATGHYQDIFQQECVEAFVQRWPVLSQFGRPLGTGLPLRAPTGVQQPTPALATSASTAVADRPRAEFIAPTGRRTATSQRARPEPRPGSSQRGALRIERLAALSPQAPSPIVIAMIGAKGGVGTTTAAAQLAMALAYGGLPVLAVDLDPQDRLLSHFGLGRTAHDGLATATLTGRSWESAVQVGAPARPVAADGFSLRVLPYGSLTEDALIDFEAAVATRSTWLQEGLDSAHAAPGTVVVVDLPVYPGAAVRQALAAADLVIGVTLADAASFLCMPAVENRVRAHCGQGVDFLGFRYLLNQVDHACRLHHDFARLLRQQYGEEIVGVVHRDQSVPEALACEMNVLDYDPQAQAAHDFATLGNGISQLLAARWGRQDGDDHAATRRQVA